jgi:hypothetical protein
MPARPAPLGSGERLLAHVSTDKPLYRPGESVFARAVVLDAFDHRPRTGGHLEFQVRSARGEVVLQTWGAIEKGVAAFDWTIPADAPGGSFTLAAAPVDVPFPESEASFDVRDYRVPRLRTDLQFTRKAYGPGDAVTATLEASLAEGGIPAGAKVVATAVVDGADIPVGVTTLDERGRCSVSFALPAELTRGDGTLALRVEDGGLRETAARTIPIVLNRVDLEFFPEGGDLVADVPCRVYFDARTPRKEPADVSGRVMDSRGVVVAQVESFHEGRGAFSLKPRKGESYRVVLDRPAGIAKEYALPPVLVNGFSLEALDATVAAGGPVRVAVASPVRTAATVGLYVRERELALVPIHIDAGVPTVVSLNPRDSSNGVLRVTVFDAAGAPRAERLVFRRPDRTLKVDVKPLGASAKPRENVTVEVVTTDERGRPVSAVLGIAATDDAVLSTVDPRERAPRLPVQALLGAEVRELKDAHRYLSGDADSPRRIDLLLGTQGWRRFAFLQSEPFLARAGEAGRRALALAPTPPPGAPRLEEWGHISRLVGWRSTTRIEVRDLDARFQFLSARPGITIMRKPSAGSGGGGAYRLGGLGVAGGGNGGSWRRIPGAPSGGGGGHAEVIEGRAGFGYPWVGESVRVYAHEVDATAEVRSDFTETVYWNAALQTDAFGRATFTFHASDALTTLRIRADGFDADGSLGSADGTVEVRRDFYAEPKAPLEVTAGDRIDLPVSLVNGGSVPLDARLSVATGSGLQVGAVSLGGASVPAGSSVRVTVPLDVTHAQGPVALDLHAEASPQSDDVKRRIVVVPAGFPAAQDAGGVLEREARHEVSIPADVSPGSVTTSATLYASPLASLTGAVAALLREPGGCFEQTSATSYPNVMALRYLQGRAGVDPALLQRAAELVERGYRRLLTFECRGGGFEWFGKDPGHEALTAYGILQFSDTAAVHPVDAEMLARTKAWLLGRRDGNGGFRLGGKNPHTFGEVPQSVVDAYVVWALVQAGEKGLEKELAHLEDTAAGSRDPYVVALAADALALSGRVATVPDLLARLASMQAEDGSVNGATTSITRSGGESLRVETTALAALAWLRSSEQAARAERAAAWLASTCRDGRFGSTQATVLALKAIVAHDAAHARARPAGKVTVTVDGEVAHVLDVPAGSLDTLTLPDLGSRLTPGKHAIALSLEGGARLPYSLTVRYHAATPASSPRAKVEIATSLSGEPLDEGAPVEVRVTTRNRTAEPLPMVVAIVGLPGGFEARPEQLKELVKEGRVDFVETRGREVILYWRGFAPREEKDLVLSCLAAVPGRYTGPASRAYLYYTDEDKAWTPPLAATIRGR